jgi:hypothetical protein
LIVKFNVSVFKQPAAFNDVCIYVPPAVYVTPLAAHVYESHEVCVNDDDVLLLIVKFNVAVFTQPAAFNDVFVYAPLAVYVTPFAAQVYESQAVCNSDDVVLLLIVSCKYVVSKQAGFAVCGVAFEYVPEAVYVFPLPVGVAQVYVSHAVALTFVITGTHAASGFKINGEAPDGLGVIVADKPVVALTADEAPGGVIKQVATQAVLPANALTCIGVKVLHCVNGLKFEGNDVAEV